jgi:hypothetical protein
VASAHVTTTGASTTAAAGSGRVPSTTASALPNGLSEGGTVQRLAALPLDEPVEAAEPQPVKQAEPSVAQLAPPGAAAAVSKPTPVAQPSTGASSMRGFLGPKSTSSAGVASQAGKAGVATAAGASKATTSSSAETTSSRSKSPAAATGTKDEVEEVDCTTSSSGSSKATRLGWNHAPAALGGGGLPNGMPGGPAQFARMMQNSHAINLAVMQVRIRVGRSVQEKQQY